MSEPTRTCTLCGQTKPTDGFYEVERFSKKPGPTTRLDAWCSACRIDYAKKYKAKHPTPEHKRRPAVAAVRLGVTVLFRGLP
jgi:hypothetical protein